MKASGTKLANKVLYNRVVLSEQKEHPTQKPHLLTSSRTLSKLELWLLHIPQRCGPKQMLSRYNPKYLMTKTKGEAMLVL